MRRFSFISNFELNKYLRGIPEFKGCYAQDELESKTIEDNSIYIVNFDESHMEGSHWVCVINGVNDMSTCIYLDSFGLPPPKRIKEFMKRQNGSNTCVMSTHTTQHTESEACGYYCMYYIFEMIKNGKRFLDCVYTFSNDPKENEKLLYEYFLKL